MLRHCHRQKVLQTD